MMDAKSAALREKLAARRELYRNDLPKRLAEIGACWDAIQRGGGDPASMQRYVHNIAGSAGTFGFGALGEKARELEHLLLARSRRPAAELASDIQSRLAALQSLAQNPDSVGLPAESSPGTAPQGQEENRRLFVVEDDPILAQEIADQLGRFGWEIQQFHNAGAALAALQAERPAAIVVDMGLPEGGLAGAGLMQQANLAKAESIPHIVISVRWDWESRLAAARAGAADYLVKPLDFGILAERLDAATRPRVGRPHRVLIVEDTAILAEHYADVLRGAGMVAMTVTEPSRILAALAEFEPNLILMDLYMPGCNGSEAARVIRQDQKFASVPIVFLSTESVRQLQLAVLQTGADDFLQKPISDADLIAAVSVRAERFRDLTALNRQDSLTGLLNHISFKLQLETEIERCKRARASLALAMIDIDRFKEVNDTYGHPVGDHVIRTLAQLLRRRLRKSDIVGRYGGEEFVILMPDTGMRSAIDVTEALRSDFQAIRYVGGQEAFHCSFSAGLAAMPPAAGMDELIRAADAALHEAKRAGRNRVHTAAAA